MLTNEEKLELLNNLKVIDYDVSGEDVVYVNVEDTPKNRDILHKVTGDVDKYIREEGDPDGMEEGIDISLAAFYHAKADIFQKGKFLILDKEELVNMLIKKDMEINSLKRVIKEFQHMTLETGERISNLLKGLDD